MSFKSLERSLLAIGLLSSFNSSAVEVSDHLTITLAHLDNVGPSWFEEDEISSSFIDVDYEKNFSKKVNLKQAISVGLLLGGRYYDNYPCDHFSFGIEARGSHRFGLGFNKTTMSLGWSLRHKNFENSSQNVTNSRVLSNLKRNINDRVSISAQLAKEWQIPDNSSARALHNGQAIGRPADALDQDWVELTLGAEIVIDQLWSMPLVFSFIDGDLENISRLRQRGIENASAVANDPSLGANWFVYRYDGKATFAEIAADRLLGDGSTVKFSISHIDAEANRVIDYNRTAFSVSWQKNW